MAIRNHFLIDSSSEKTIVQAALAELVAQQARVVASKAATNCSVYDVKRSFDLLARIVEVSGES